MYAEQLFTPSQTKRTEGITPQPLLEVVDPLAVQERIATAKSIGEGIERTIGEAHTISRIVNESVDFRTRDTALRGLSPENMGGSQVSDCFGYTMVLSECLEQAGIDHMLAYSNGHGFAVVTDQKSYAWMVDGLSPCLNADMYHAIDPRDLKELPGLIEKYGHGAVRFSSSIYSMGLSLSDSFEELCEKNPWMKMSSMIRDPRSDPKLITRDQTLIVSLFTPSLGRQVFEDIRNFEALRSQSKNVEAYNALRRLHGVFPELDSRNKLSSIREFIRTLAAKGYTTLAINATDSIAASFTPELSKDKRLATWRGDRLRDIGRIASNPTILQKAIDSYQEDANPRHPLVIGKITKTQGMIRNCK